MKLATEATAVVLVQSVEEADRAEQSTRLRRAVRTDGFAFAVEIS
jgi:hypothetical protein